MAPLAMAQPEAMATFGAYDKLAMADGTLSAKTKELLAVGVALTTQCQYCHAIHSEMAREAGATEEELSEVIVVASMLRARAAITHGANHVLEG